MRKIIFSAIALFVSLSLNAQILYKISGNGAKGESYVMGTHHLAPISILDSIAGFDVAISSVDAVYGEIEQSEMNSPTSVQKMMSMATAPADSTLSKVFWCQGLSHPRDLSVHNIGSSRITPFSVARL